LLLGATHSKDERLKAQNPGAAMNPLIPMVVEQTVHGERAFDFYSRLLNEHWLLRKAPGRRCFRSGCRFGCRPLGALNPTWDAGSRTCLPRCLIAGRRQREEP
jgi:hypothetical protein